MRWNLKLNGEGYYWYEATLPRGRICDVECPHDGREWQARMYERQSCDGLLLATAPDADQCKERAIVALRKIGRREAAEWKRALR